MRRFAPEGDGGSTVRPADSSASSLTVQVYDRIAPSTLPAMWWLYEAAFEEINALAVQRHRMTFAELDAVAADDRVMKYLAWQDGRLVGLSVMTDDLAAWTLVSPEFFARKYPGRKVFYVGFVAAKPGSPGAYEALVRRMYEDVIEVDGVAVMDFCEHNVGDRLIDSRVDTLLRRINPDARGGLIDAQFFYAWDFRKGEAGDPVL